MVDSKLCLARYEMFVLLVHACDDPCFRLLFRYECQLDLAVQEQVAHYDLELLFSPVACESAFNVQSSVC